MPSRLTIMRPDGLAQIDIPDETLVLTPDLQFEEPSVVRYVLATAAPIDSLYTPFTVDQIATEIQTRALWSYSVIGYRTVPTVEFPDPDLITEAEIDPPSVILCTGFELKFVPVVVVNVPAS